MKLEALQSAFPNTRNNKALTDYIPIDYYNDHRRAIRNVIKEHNLQLYFRGTRNNASLYTLKRDAHSIVLYPPTKNVVTERDQLLHYAKKVDDTLNIIVGILLFAIAMFIGYITYNSNDALQFSNCMHHSVNQFFTAIGECLN